MWFRRRAPEPTRADRWAAYAAGCGATPAEDVAERLKRFLDLDDAEVRHVHVRRTEGAASLYLFDVVRRRRGPAGEVVRWATWGLVRAAAPWGVPSFRASPRRDEVLESLDASRSGAVRVDLAAYPDLDRALAVFAREAAAVRAALVPSVTTVLARLVAVGGGATVTVGDRHLIGRLAVDPEGDPADVAPLAGGLLALATALGALAPVAIEEDDFLAFG